MADAKVLAALTMMHAHPVATDDSKKLVAKTKRRFEVTAVLPNDRYEVQDLWDLRW